MEGVRMAQNVGRGAGGRLCEIIDLLIGQYFVNILQR